jgi:serine protease inhibitor
VWIDDGSTLNPSYLKVVEDFIYQIDFKDDRAGALVNEWVKTSTRDLIDSIVPDGRLAYQPVFLPSTQSI